MDRTLSYGGIRGRFSKAASEQLEMEIQFALQAAMKGYEIPPEQMALVNEMQLEMHIRQYVTGRANGTIEKPKNPF
jgi:hypothetical protein